MAEDHGSSVKNDKQYEGLREKGLSKARSAAISNSKLGPRRLDRHGGAEVPRLVRAGRVSFPDPAAA